MFKLMIATAGIASLATAQSPRIETPDPHPTYTFGDFDGDALQDILSLDGGRVQILQNLGDGTFLDTTLRSGLAQLSRVRTTAMADFNGDGRADILVLGQAECGLFRAEPNGVFSKLGAESGLVLEGVLDARWTDLDADGDLDLFTWTSDEERIFENAGTHFLEVTLGSAPDHPSGASPGTGDVGLALGGNSCVPALEDSAFPGQCVSASLIPSLGRLLPLGAGWSIDASTGYMGVFAGTAQEAVDVADMVRSRAGGFQFPDGSLQVTAAPAGPQGPAGAQGPAGDLGPEGGQGPVGPTGDTGPVGAQGDAGPQGVAGPQGATGSQGAAGAAGSDGIGYLGTHRLFVSAAQFDAEHTLVSVDRFISQSALGAHINVDTNTDSLIAPIYLPDGAQTLSCTVVTFDEATSADLEIQVWRTLIGGGNDYELLAVRVSTGSGGIAIDTFAFDHTVDSADWIYYVQVTPNGTGWEVSGALGIKSVTFEYTWE